jgi:galactose mutarotase-like enzyme
MQEIEIRHGDDRALIAPERGGMVTQWRVDGREILYLDRTTLEDPTKNVRGGIPLLFPSPGKLEGDAWAHGTLKQHGFARNVAWSILARTESATTLRLESSAVTRAAYPFEFVLDVRYRIEPRALVLEARVECRGVAMPFGFGTHPYFTLGDAKVFAIRAGATRAFDNVTRQDVAFDARALLLGQREIDLHLIDHDAASIELATDLARVTIEAPDHRRWVIWNPPGKPFVCVEPWTAPGNALNTGIDVITLSPGASRSLTQTFRVA